MKLFKLFMLRSPRFMVLATTLGIAGAIAKTGIVALVNVILIDGPSTALAFVFFGLCVLQIALSGAGGAVFVIVGQNVVYDLRIELSRSILELPLRRLEELGPAKLYAALTDDVVAVTRGGYMMAGVLLQAGFIAASMAYLAWLSPKGFVVVAVVVATSVVIARRLAKRASALLAKAREKQDTLHKGFHGITSGTKELKLHAARLTDFLAQMIEQPGRGYMEKQRASAAVSFVGGQGTSFLFLLLIGALVFTAARVPVVQAANLTKYVLTILAVQATVELFLHQYPMLLMADVAYDKMRDLGLTLRETVEPTKVTALEGCKEIALRGIVHEYRREHEDGTFTLGPVDLVLRPGEIVFIVGGNGSGKSTLMKVLTGLYPPLRGEIRVDGRVVDDASRPAYRALFSAIFSDFYLFDKLHGLDPGRVLADAQRYLVELRIDKKVTIQNGAFSTSKLSQGQRKRLMLLIAYLEDRPVYVFDEWASDQDPIFKEVFYRRILPALKARGKTVVVVSHDDRYFNAADRLVALEDGHLTHRIPGSAMPPVGTMTAAGVP